MPSACDAGVFSLTRVKAWHDGEGPVASQDDLVVAAVACE